MTILKGFFSAIWSNTNYRSAALVFVVLTLWLLSGVLFTDTQTHAQAQPTSAAHAEPMTVQVRHLQAERYPIKIQLRGRTEANREVIVRAETLGRVSAVPSAEGERVTQGATLCELAVDDRQVRVDEAQAQVDAAKLEYDGALRLKSGGYQSQAAIANAKAKWESAKASLLSRQLDVQHLTIKAPFAGVINRRSVEVGDYLKVGDECAMLLEMDPLIVAGRISETEVSQLGEGDSATVNFAAGTTVQGRVVFIESQADEHLRTFAVEVAIPNPDFALRGGMSATLSIHTREVSAHQIPANVLALDDAGHVGVKVVNSEQRVVFKPVQIIGDGGASLWVTGLAAEETLISVGQEYVSVGQQVVAVDESGWGSLPVVAQ